MASLETVQATVILVRPCWTAVIPLGGEGTREGVKSTLIIDIVVIRYKCTLISAVTVKNVHTVSVQSLYLQVVTSISLAGPVPALLTAATRTVYRVDEVSPETVAALALPSLTLTTLSLSPLVPAITVYTVKNRVFWKHL